MSNSTRDLSAPGFTAPSVPVSNPQNPRDAVIPSGARLVGADEEALALEGRAQSLRESGAPRPGEYVQPALKRFSVELRYGPQMMSASAEVSAPSVDTIMAAIMEQGGLRLTTKLPTSSPSATSFQKGAFIFTQSIHSVVIIEELK